MSGRNSAALQPERCPPTFELHDLDSASERADQRAAASGLELADFEDENGRLEGEARAS